MADYDIFIWNKIYPNAEDIFATELKSVEQVKNKCLFVLDTNALLLPYTTSSKSIDEIKKVYAKLIKEKRLFIPGQVAREFAKNRPEKIKELFQKLNRKKTEIKKLYQGQYPLLQGIKVYEDAIKQEKEIDELLKDYTKKIDKVVNQIKKWTWNDPVSVVYNKLFSKETIIDFKIDEQKIKTDLDKRYSHKIPPGFKDENKEDLGIGDLLIWYTILELSEKQKLDIIFVSGEEKTDWYYKSEGQALYPRFELLSEFRQKSDKKSFHIVKLSELLELFGADDQVIEEVKFEEKTTTQRLTFGHLSAEIQRIEKIAYDWVIKQFKDEYEIIYNHVGFPDFVLTKGDKDKVGIEVKSFQNSMSFSHRLGDMINKAYYEFNENGYTKFIFILIFPQKEDIREDTIRRLKSMIDKYSNSNMECEFVLGIIDHGVFEIFPM